MYKVNEVVKITYVALDFKTGLLDIKLTPIDPAGIVGADVILAELVSAPGVYQGSFTPDSIGAWTVKIGGSSTNDKGAKQIDVAERNAEDVYSQNLAISADLDDIKGVGFNSNANSLKAISEEIAPGGYIA